MYTGIFIDDTGSPNQITKSKYLTDDRKTYVAVLFSPEERLEATTQLAHCIDFNKEQFGANEFHFTDIYRGSNEFKHVNLSIRLGIFETFVHIYNQYRWKFIVQTVSDRTLLEHGTMFQYANGEGFDMTKNSDVALLFLLVQCKTFLIENQNKYPLPVDFIIDSGKRDGRTTQPLSILTNIYTDSSIKYEYSHESILLQIADFLAFSINRTQMIMAKDSKTPTDVRFINIMSKLQQNAIGLKKVAYPKTPIEYDQLIRADKDMKGLISDEKYIEIERRLK